jgi:hypothetical protein
MNDPVAPSLESRLAAVEDELAIYRLIATHPLSADTGDRAFIDAIYAPDVSFDRGPELEGASGRDNMAALVSSEAHRTAIAGGLAHFAGLPRVEVNGDTAAATSYLALITPDAEGEPRELANHGESTGFRIHRVLANRWTFVRTPEGWRIASRTLLPTDGSPEAQELLLAARGR